MALLSKHIPLEIVSNILLKLPVESILQCMLVCKSWYSLIKNPNFVAKHMNYSSSASTHLLCFSCNAAKHMNNPSSSIHIRSFSCNSDHSIGNFSLLSDRTFDDEGYKLDSPFDSQCLFLVGSLNGLVALKKTCPLEHKVYICNPSVGFFKTITSTSFPPDRPISRLAMGFAYCCKSNDYKVVRVSYSAKYDTGGFTVTEAPPLVAEVYSLITDSWKVFEISMPMFPYFRQCSGTLFNGSLYWVMLSSMYFTGILSFDVGREVFEKIEIEPFGDLYWKLDNGMEASLGVLSEHLSLFGFNSLTRSRGNYKDCEVWYRVADSWTFQFHVVVDRGVKRTLCFTKNDEVILENGSSEVVVYDIKARKKLATLDISATKNLDCVPYMKSLVLLDKGKELTGLDGWSRSGCTSSVSRREDNLCLQNVKDDKFNKRQRKNK